MANLELTRRLVVAQLRDQWRNLVVLGLLIGVAGGVAIAALAGARRTETALERLEVQSRSWDLDVLLADSPPGLPEEIVRVDGVVGARISRGSVGALLDAPTLTFIPVYASSEQTVLGQGVLQRGRRPNPGHPHEVVMSEGMAKAFRLDVGSTIKWHGLSHEQFLQFGEAPFETYDGPRVDLKVVGITREPSDVLSPFHPTLRATPAFLDTYGDQLQRNYSVALQLRDDANIDAVEQAINDVAEARNPTDPLDAFSAADVTRLDLARPQLDDTTAVLVRGLWAVAIVAAIAAALVGALVTARYVRRANVDRAPLRAMGLSTPYQFGRMVIPVALSMLVAAVVSFVIAAFASPLTPIGVARRAEPDPGFTINWSIAGLGVLVVAVLTVGIAAIIAGREVFSVRRSAGRLRAPSAAARVSAIAPRPSTQLGIRLAIESDREVTAFPIRSAIAGTVIGIAGIVMALTFGASLTYLVDTPSEWGYPADHTIELPIGIRTETLTRLEAAKEVEALGVVSSTDVQLGDRRVLSYGIDQRKGDFGPTILEGRRPERIDEVVLAPRTMATLKVDGRPVQIGDVLRARLLNGETRDLRVVGRGLGFGSENEGFTRGAMFTNGGLARVGLGQPFVSGYVRYRDGVDPDEAARRLYGGLEYSGPPRPPQVAGLDDVRNLPNLVLALLAVLTLVTLTHAVFSAGRRQRRDTAILRSLGMTGRETARMFRVMAVTMAVVAVVVGIPLGVLAGTALWGRVATGIDLESPTRLPWVFMLVTVPVTVLAALLPAAIAGARSRKMQPAEALHNE